MLTTNAAHSGRDACNRGAVAAGRQEVSKMNVWQSRVALAGEVDRAEQAIEAAKNGAETVQAEKQWGQCWDELHDVDDQIFATQAGNVTEIAIKAQIWRRRGNEDTPYLHYGRSIARDAIALAGAGAAA
jgi:hypothetical protein